jgi:hypothetical protein
VARGYAGVHPAEAKVIQAAIPADGAKKANIERECEFIIEVKRASTSKGLIDADLQRLAAAFALIRAPFSLSFQRQTGQEDLFSRRDIPSEESIRYQSPAAITE